MGEVGVRELKQSTSAILRRVREDKEAFTITHRGREIARLIPVEDVESNRAKAREVWAAMDELAAEITPLWPSGVSAADAVKEQRREL